MAKLQNAFLFVQLLTVIVGMYSNIQSKVQLSTNAIILSIILSRIIVNSYPTPDMPRISYFE